MINYYFYRLSLTFNSWKYWISQPYENLVTLSEPYSPGDLYWSIREKGNTIAANFWYMVNDGHYDMLNEFFDT
jgi:hypothetical protein